MGKPSKHSVNLLFYLDINCYGTQPSMYMEIRYLINQGDDADISLCARLLYMGNSLANISCKINTYKRLITWFGRKRIWNGSGIRMAPELLLVSAYSS